MVLDDPPLNLYREETQAALFHTEDLQNAVKTFLSEGPGRATFEGR